MKLSKNFTLAEFTRSATALRMDIDNTPPPGVEANIQALVTSVLQPLRDKFGPIRVTSGYRSPELNRHVPGAAANSQHCTGEAADIEPVAEGATVADLFIYTVEHLPFDQVIFEYPPNGWLHVSFGPRHRRDKFVKRAFAGYKPVTVKDGRVDE